jgi:hypothetical protein
VRDCSLRGPGERTQGGRGVKFPLPFIPSRQGRDNLQVYLPLDGGG